MQPDGSTDLLKTIDQRDAGRRLVLSTIRRNGNIARIDIANETGISPATVTNITAELLTAGLIEETARDPETSGAKRGRPRVDLTLRGEAHLVAGLKVSNKKITVAILDFEGALVCELALPIPKPTMEREEFAALVRAALTAAVENADLQLSDLSGVGVGLAGIIDAPVGLVHWTPSLTERNVPLRDVLAKELGLPVFIDNDANLLAKAEQWFGVGRDVNNFIVVTIEQGVGMGIVIDGKIYRGTRGFGAEFGHTKVQLDGALCRCGQRGCLEAYISDYALLREANIVPGASGTEQQLKSLFDEAKNGNQMAQSIFHRAGRMFGMGLANIVNVFDPALIILSGERMQLGYLYADEVIENMKNSIVATDSPPPDVRIHKWGDEMWAKGAAALALEGVTGRQLNDIAAST